MTAALEACPICTGEGAAVGSIPDAASPTGRWDLWRCHACSTGWATPLVVPDGYYDAIYGSEPPITGYLRYRRLARMVERRSNPLSWLAGQQDVYWAARRFLEVTAPEGPIAEVGSGLGYLTHAVHAAGRDVVGLDLSGAAVERATQRFGGHYRVCDLAALDQDLHGAFAAVVGLEVMEHATDPVAFVAGCLELLRPGGRLLLTTPDRDSHAESDLWRTDPPPVHLFWFGRRGIEAISERLAVEVEFLDFTDFNRTHRQAVPQPSTELPGPFLDRELQPLAQAGTRERLIDAADHVPGVGTALRSIVRSVQGARRAGPSSAALAAVFTR